MNEPLSTQTPTTEPLLIDREGAVLVLTNNNPAARNALTPAFYLALRAALADADADPETGAIVLTGAGGAFCSGGDLRQLSQRQALSRDERRMHIERLHDLIRSIRACSKPVIAAVEGAAAGAGLSLALACDMLVAARNAVFSVAYVKVGLTPDGGATAFLAEHLSRQVMTELCLTGERVTGERMDRLGVVNRLTEPGEALATAIALAATIAAGPERSMARIKDLCRHAGESTLDAQMDREATFMVESLGDEEGAEGIAAFLAKRPAAFMALRRKPRSS